MEASGASPRKASVCSHPQGSSPTETPAHSAEVLAPTRQGLRPVGGRRRGLGGGEGGGPALLAAQRRQAWLLRYASCILHVTSPQARRDRMARRGSRSGSGAALAGLGVCRGPEENDMEPVLRDVSRVMGLAQQGESLAIGKCRRV